jgi:hypothetical protein
MSGRHLMLTSVKLLSDSVNRTVLEVLHGVGDAIVILTVWKDPRAKHFQHQRVMGKAPVGGGIGATLIDRSHATCLHEFPVDQGRPLRMSGRRTA